MGALIETAIELVDMALASSAGATTWFARTMFQLNPSDYDGNPLFFFEIIESDATGSGGTVTLFDITDATPKTVITTATGESIVRKRAAFTPAAGLKTYAVGTSGPAGQSVWRARVIIQQDATATKTKIAVPLFTWQVSGTPTATNDATLYLDDNYTTAYAERSTGYHSFWQYVAADWANIPGDASALTLETVMAAANASYGVNAGLSLVTAGTASATPVSGSTLAADLTNVNVTCSQKSFALSGLTDGGVYTVVSHGGNATGRECMLQQARLYIKLSNAGGLSKFCSYFRVGGQGVGTSSVIETYQRYLLNQSSIGGVGFNTAFYLAATGYDATTEENLYLRDSGTKDTGSSGDADISDSALQFASATRNFAIAGPFTPPTDGDRVYTHRVTTTGSAAQYGTMVVAKVTVSTGPTITGLSVSHGPIGHSVTVTGTGFGASKGSSVVKLGGTVATTTGGWSATQFTATVPSLSHGPWTWIVTVSGLPSNAFGFTVDAPPFLRYDGASLVSAPLQVMLPDGLGSKTLMWYDGVGLRPVATGTAPTPPPPGNLAAISLSSGTPGTWVTLTGVGFGAVRGPSKVYFGNYEATACTDWTDTSVRAMAPLEAMGASVPVHLVVNGSQTNGINFTVTSILPFNVDGYGAVGNKTHDDTAAIGSAWTACQNAGQGYLHFTPGKSYLITNPTILLATIRTNDWLDTTTWQPRSGSSVQRAGMIFVDGLSTTGGVANAQILFQAGNTTRYAFIYTPTYGNVETHDTYGNLVVQNLDFNDNGRVPSAECGSIFWLRDSPNADNFVFKNLTLHGAPLRSQTTGLPSLAPLNGIFFKGGLTATNPTQWSFMRQLVIDGCTLASQEKEISIYGFSNANTEETATVTQRLIDRVFVHNTSCDNGYFAGSNIHIGEALSVGLVVIEGGTMKNSWDDGIEVNQCMDLTVRNVVFQGIRQCINTRWFQLPHRSSDPVVRLDTCTASGAGHYWPQGGADGGARNSMLLDTFNGGWVPGRSVGTYTVPNCGVADTIYTTANALHFNNSNTYYTAITVNGFTYSDASGNCHYWMNVNQQSGPNVVVNVSNRHISGAGITGNGITTAGSVTLNVS